MELCNAIASLKPRQRGLPAKEKPRAPRDRPACSSAMKLITRSSGEIRSEAGDDFAASKNISVTIRLYTLGIANENSLIRRRQSSFSSPSHIMISFLVFFLRNMYVVLPVHYYRYYAAMLYPSCYIIFLIISTYFITMGFMFNVDGANT